MTKDFFQIIQIVIGIIITALILLQSKGVGFGRSMAGGTYHSRRGMEFVVFRTTIILSVLFVLIAIAGQILI